MKSIKGQPLRTFIKFIRCSGITVCTLLASVGSVDAQPKAAAPTVVYNPATAKSVGLVPFLDPWASARDRWWDVSNDRKRQLNAFLDGSQTFTYRHGQVTLSYEPNPNVPYFVGHIKARGLKPNFAYQIKLVGKPQRGSRGFGTLGDDVGNERLGYAGRWWCDSYHSTQTNFDDSHYENFYKKATPGTEHNIYGYIYTGMFVTDRLGNASLDFTGSSSYHVTWASWQSGIKDVEDHKSPFSVQGGLIKSNPTTYYGYGSAAPLTSARLYYEYEGFGRPRDNVQLAPGTYNCRLLLTEESFHSSATSSGGYWKSVLTSEDFSYNSANQPSPDTNMANDIVFTVAAPSAPAAPASLTATGYDSRVELSWTASPGASSYSIKRSTTAGGPYATLATGATSTTYNDTFVPGGATVVNGTTYYYVVTASNTFGEGAASTEAFATPQAPPAPASPANLTATAVSNQRIDLTWTDTANNEGGFKIWRTLEGQPFNEEKDLIKGLGPNVQSYSDSGLMEASIYHYRVRAYNAGGDSELSNIASAITQVGPSLPTAPMNLQATPGSRLIALRWTDSSNNENGFRIERSMDGQVFTPLAVVGAGIVSYTNSGLKSNVPYFYRVLAYNDAGNSQYSNTISAKAGR